MGIIVLSLASLVLLSGLVVGIAHASVSFDKGVYTWTDKVHITAKIHGWNADEDSADISTSAGELKLYRLSKAGNGLYKGEFILTGFSHDANGNGKPDTNPRTVGVGPNDGFLESGRDDDLKITLRFGNGDKVSTSAKITWNVGKIAFDKPAYSMADVAKLRVSDPDMNLNPETLDSLPIHVFSDSDKAGIEIDAIETHDESGMFEAELFFTADRSSSGDRLFSVPGDAIYGRYGDHTLPFPYGASDDLAITVKSALGPDAALSAVQSHAGKIAWDLPAYSGHDRGMVHVSDPDMDLDPNMPDDLAVHVWSSSGREWVEVLLSETGKSTGIFEGHVEFSVTGKPSGQHLLVSPGDTVSAKYGDGVSSSHTTFDDLLVFDTSEIRKPFPNTSETELSISLHKDDACRDGLDKILKHGSEHFACVKPSSVEKLVLRGWGSAAE